MTSPPAETDGSDSSTPQGVPTVGCITRDPDKKRKRTPTYYVRKEEKREAAEEVARLEARIRELEAEKKEQRESELATIKQIKANVELQQHIKQHHLAIAGTQSLLSNNTNPQQWRTPMTSYIRLGLDPSERSHTLLGIRDEKLQDSVQFLLARASCLDLHHSYRQEDTFETANGDYILVGFDVTPIHGTMTVRQVFDAGLVAANYEEFSAMERLGVVATRDTDYSDDNLVTQSRFLSTHATGVDVEANNVCFTKFVDKSDQLDAPHGIRIVDFVDDDELYPYQPATRVRKDVTQVAMIYEAPSRPSGSKQAETATGNNQRSVAIVRWVNVRMHKPVCPVSRKLELQLREDVLHWCKIMHTDIQDIMSVELT